MEQKDTESSSSSSSSSYQSMMPALQSQPGANREILELKIRGIQRVEDYTIRINVTSLRYTSYYQHLLADIGRTLSKRLDKLNQSLQHSQLSIDTQKVVENYLQGLVVYYETEIISFLGREINGYKKEVPQGDIDDFFNNYLRTRKNKGYSERLKPTTEVYKKITDNFINSGILALNRITNDFDETICPGFLSDNKSEWVLTEIGLTGSDLHKNGQQVLILTFSNKKSKHKVVYKPSPVTADMMLVGDLSRLPELHKKKYHGQSSLLEIAERMLEKTTVPEYISGTQLPKYLIVPMGDSDNVKDYYGYIEFLSHAPTLNIDEQTIFEASMQKMSLEARDKNVELK